MLERTRCKVSESRCLRSWLGFSLGVLGCLWVPGSQAETITLGPAGSGCTFTDLTGAIVRAAITAEDDLIAVAGDLTYTGSVALNLTNEGSVTLRGVTSCAEPETRMERTITHTRAGLFDFVGTSIVLESLRIDNNSPNGRPLTLGGNAGILLDQAVVEGGRGDLGGNVFLYNGADLFAIAGSSIENGFASGDGGGIYCAGSGSTVALFAGSRVAFNQTSGNGGGIFAESCTVNVFSGGAGLGVLGNGALGQGGGIYATNGANVFIESTSGIPADIVGNSAGQYGGGVAAGVGSTSIITLTNANVSSNSAQLRGGGLFLGNNGWAFMERDPTSCGALSCSTLANNEAPGSVGVEGFGGAVAVASGGFARIFQTYLSDNSALAGGRVADADGGLIRFEGSVLYDNEPEGIHMLARQGGTVELNFVSAWGSSSPGNEMAFAAADTNGRIVFRSSLVIEGNGEALGGGGTDTLFAQPGPGGIHSADCVIAHEIASYSGDPRTLREETDPAAIWADPAAGDPHLAPSSEAIDFCDDLFYRPVTDDIDGESRGRDVEAPNFIGPFDLGADEADGGPPTGIFADGFESGTTRAWSWVVSGNPPP